MGVIVSVQPRVSDWLKQSDRQGLVMWRRSRRERRGTGRAGRGDRAVQRLPESKLT